MRIVSTGYSKTPGFDDPQQWLARISFYTAILDELAVHHEVFSIERINYEGEYQQKGVHYFFIRQRNLTVHFPVAMHNLIKKLKPDIVLVNGFIFPLQIIQLRWKLGRKVKIIILHRAERPFTGIKRYFQRLADKCVNAYLFTSSAFGNEWKPNIDTSKIHEVIQASSLFTVIDRTKATGITQVSGSPVFLWVGRLLPGKDPLLVVKAFLEFLRHEPGARLYMIYQSAELLNEINDLLDNNKEHRHAIVLVGAVPHEQLLYWYNSADFFISASHYEGSGIAVTEAMSCGCIVIVSDIISFQRMTGPGKCGLMFEKGNGKGLLATLLKTRGLDKEKERNKVLQQFDQELSTGAIAKKIELVIGSL